MKDHDHATNQKSPQDSHQDPNIEVKNCTPERAECSTDKVICETLTSRIKVSELQQTTANSFQFGSTTTGSKGRLGLLVKWLGRWLLLETRSVECNNFSPDRLTSGAN